MIRIDTAWLAVEPLDMRAGPDTALARVVRVFGEARPHHAYLFANRRATLLKVLVHDGFGVWLCARRLHQGKFSWATIGASLPLTQEQLQALVLGLPWHRLGEFASIRVACLQQSAKLNGIDPHAYLRDVLARLPTQPASRIEELLPHRWAPE